MNILLTALFMVIFFISAMGTMPQDDYDPERDPANMYVNQKFDDLDKRVTYLEGAEKTSAENYKKDKDAVETHINNTNEFKKSAEIRMNNLATDVASAQEKVTDMQNGIKEVKKDIKILKNADKNQNEKMAKLDNTLTEKVEKIKQLDVKTNKKFDEKTNDLEKEIKAFTEKLALIDRQSENDQAYAKTIFAQSINRIIMVQSTLIAIPVIYGIYKLFAEKIKKYFESSTGAKSTSFVKKVGKILVSLSGFSTIFGAVNYATFKGISWLVKDADFTFSSLLPQ